MTGRTPSISWPPFVSWSRPLTLPGIIRPPKRCQMGPDARGGFHHRQSPTHHHYYPHHLHHHQAIPPRPSVFCRDKSHQATGSAGMACRSVRPIRHYHYHRRRRRRQAFQAGILHPPCRARPSIQVAAALGSQPTPALVAICCALPGKRPGLAFMLCVC